MSTEPKAFELTNKVVDASERQELEINQTIQKDSAHMPPYAPTELFDHASISSAEDATFHGYLTSVGILFVNKDDVDINHRNPISTTTFRCCGDSRVPSYGGCASRMLCEHEDLYNDESLVNDRATESWTTVVTESQADEEEDDFDYIFSWQEDSDSDSGESYSKFKKSGTYTQLLLPIPLHVSNENYTSGRSFKAIFPLKDWPTHKPAMPEERKSLWNLGIDVDDAVVTKKEQKLMEDPELRQWRCQASSLRRSWTYCRSLKFEPGDR